MRLRRMPELGTRGISGRAGHAAARPSSRPRRGTGHGSPGPARPARDRPLARAPLERRRRDLARHPVAQDMHKAVGRARRRQRLGGNAEDSIGAQFAEEAQVQRPGSRCTGHGTRGGILEGAQIEDRAPVAVGVDLPLADMALEGCARRHAPCPAAARRNAGTATGPPPYRAYVSPVSSPGALPAFRVGQASRLIPWSGH